MSKKLINLSLLILILINTDAYAASPSFSCQRASTKVEHAICNNRLLSALDNQMSKAYKNVMNEVSFTSKNNIRSAQVNWRKERESCSYNYNGAEDMHECIKVVYRERYNKLKRITPVTNSRSREMYVQGNKEYRAGYYYQALKYYHKALDNAGDDVDRIRALGALAQVSKEKEDYTLSKAYAEKILEIDSSSQFAQKIARYKKTIRSYSSSSSTTTSSSYNENRNLKCLALTWGPDVCSHQFNKFASKELGGSVNDIINSPVCAVSIATAMGETLSDGDIEVAMLTGMLDEIGQSGVGSDNFFGKVFGVISYFYSFSIKTIVYDTCMGK